MAGVGQAADAKQIASGARDVGAILEPIRKRHDLPALAGAVYYQGRMAALGATGVRKIGEPTPVTVNDQFHLGSCTKSMTATLAAMLAEEHKLDWNAPLITYFPELRSNIAPDLRSVTLAQLACHRSGITAESLPKGMDFKASHEIPGSFREQRQVYAERILQEEPLSAPGTQYLYSNRNFALLGIIAERVANEGWEELITRRLFKPLGMKSAGFQAMGTPGKLNQPWQHRATDRPRLPIGPGRYSDNPEVIGPAGTVHCSMVDWLKYATAHTVGEGGGSKLLKPTTYHYLHTAQFGGEYAFGWIVTERPWGGGKVLTHSGSNNQNFAVVWIAPLRDFAVVAATNQGGGGADKACDEVAATMIGTFLR